MCTRLCAFMSGASTGIIIVTYFLAYGYVLFRCNSLPIIYNCCLSDFVQSLLAELLPNCDGELKADVTQMAAYYEHRLQLGSKAIFHLEAFVAKFMSIYKRFVEEGLDLMFS